MRASIRRMGNSAGIILPKPVLAELGLQVGDDVSLSMEKGRLVLAPAQAHPRAGWAEDARRLAAAGGDELVWPEFANDADDYLTTKFAGCDPASSSPRRNCAIISTRYWQRR